MSKKAKQIGGMLGFFDDLETESEEPLTDAVSSALVDLKDEILGLGKKEKSHEAEEKFTSTGEIADFQKKKEAQEEETKKKAEEALAKARVQIVTQEEVIYDQQHKIKAQREFARLIGSAMSEDQKNALLHVSLDYAQSNTDNPYHMVNLRAKLKEKMDEEQKTKEAQEVKTLVTKKGKGGVNLDKVAEGGQAQLSTTGGGGIG